MAPDSGISGAESHVIEATAFVGANSRAYLSAVFAAYRDRRVVVALPKSAADSDVPGVEILERRAFDDDPGWFDERLEPIHDDAPAQVSFSSGTTGKPKALLLSHRALADVVGRINAAMEIDGSIREYVGVPVTFSFGFGRVRAVAAAGGRSFLPAHGFDPGEIARMLQAGEINAVSAVPTLWRVVLANPQVIGKAGACVRWIEIGSQYMSAEEKQAMKRLFPNARIVQHYGLTEASRTTLLDISRAPEDRLESVGRAEGRVEIGIAGDGAIRVRGPHVAEGLVTEEGVTPVTDADGWLVTADRGRIEDGWLYYEGRTDELVNVGGVKVDPTRFEQLLATRLGRPEAVAIGRAADPLRGERVLVAVEEASGLDRGEVTRAAVAVATELGLAGTGTFELRTVDDIPRTATGKVRRAALSELPDRSGAPEPSASAAADVSTEPPASGDAAARAAELQRIWASALGLKAVPVDASFYDLGGDSLSALTVILRMEAAGLDAETARGLFDGKTIAELAGLPVAAGGGAVTVPEAPASTGEVGASLTLAEAMAAIHGTRGILALWVVTIHWMGGVLARLPGQPTWLWDTLQPVIRFGTPGFAIVFGLGIGALGIPQYLRSPEQFRAGSWLKFRLVFAGVLLMALFSFGVRWSVDDLGDPLLLSRMFYSAISYYALALLALPWIMRGLTAWPQHILVTVFAAMALSLAINQILAATIAPLRPDGLLELIKILLTAKYGFFRMTSYVLVGVAIGYLFRQHYDRPGIVRTLSIAGATLVAVGYLTGQEASPGAVFAFDRGLEPWHVAVYAGAAMLILGLFCHLNRNGGVGLTRPVAFFVGLATASGILALPIYVGHQLVLPAKAFMANLGVPEAVAIAIPVVVFLGLLAVGYLRLMRVVWR